jgi:hypothetical protein
MTNRTGAVRRAAGTVGMCCLAVAVGGMGVAVAESHGSTIHGCVAKSDGTLRIVHGSKDCTSHEKPISWSKRGPKGPRGAPGTSGQSTSAATSQMYANVDQNGHLGSNYDAVSASLYVPTPPAPGATQYQVTFARSVIKCAITVTSGYADGNDEASYDVPVATANSSDPDLVTVSFGYPDGNGGSFDGFTSAFMMTVTCPASDG